MNVTREQIEALAKRIAEEFRPQRVILFGSQARGTPNEDSDVDLLVVLPFSGPRYRTAAKIRTCLPHGIPIDVVVRSPDEAGRAVLGDILLHEALHRGVDLYRAA